MNVRESFLLVERTERRKVWRRGKVRLPTYSLKGRLWFERGCWGRGRVVRAEDEEVGRDLLMMKGLTRSVTEPGLYPNAASYGSSQETRILDHSYSTEKVWSVTKHQVYDLTTVCLQNKRKLGYS